MEHELSKWLKTRGQTITGIPLYRVVWSDSEYEFRCGTFREFTESNLFIREVTGTKLVPKYSYIHSRWIFEKWAPGSLVADRSIPGTEHGDYIPVYVFEDKNGNSLPVTRKVLEFLLAHMNGQVRKDQVPSQEYLEEREVKSVIESLDDHPLFSTHGETRDSVAYTKEIKDAKL